MQIVLTNKAAKLIQLCKGTGLNRTDELLALATTESVALGICMNRGCDYITEVEADQRGGICEHCDDNTVCSALVLADMI
jgi:hypothetical protein